MDAGIADTINRHVAELVAQHLDTMDAQLRTGMILPGDLNPWYDSPLAETFIGTNGATGADRAWQFVTLAARTPGLHFDGTPADCDWDNLFTHFRQQIMARR